MPTDCLFAKGQTTPNDAALRDTALAHAEPAHAAPTHAAPDKPAPNYPVNLVLTNRPCLVVGGGNVAIRKIEGLINSGAFVTVVAPEIRPEIAAMANVTTIERTYETGDLSGFFLAITCTDDPAVNHQVFIDGEATGAWVNSADDPINCAFTLPAVARQGDLSLAISTAGRSPALAMWLRRRFETEFDERYARLLDVLSTVRAEARAELGTSEVNGWIEALDSGVFDHIVNQDDEAAANLLRQYLGLQPHVPKRHNPQQSHDPRQHDPRQHDLHPFGEPRPHDRQPHDVQELGSTSTPNNTQESLV